MPELHFAIEGAEAVANAAAPLIALKLNIANLPATEMIHALTLRCQVQIEPARRSYVRLLPRGQAVAHLRDAVPARLC